MGRLSNAEITNIILARGFEPVDISGYQNKSTKLTCKCKEGHIFNAALADIMKTSFTCPKCTGERFAAAINEGKVPTKNGYRILALDQSSQVSGLSIWDDGKLVYYDCVKNVGELEVRLVKWSTWLKERLDEWQPDYVIVEDIQEQGNSGVVTYKILAMILGITLEILQERDIPHTSILNKKWQSMFSIAGSNRISQKKNVMERVKEYFSIEVSDDVADAILIGLYAVRQEHAKWGEQKVF